MKFTPTLGVGSLVSSKHVVKAWLQIAVSVPLSDRSAGRRPLSRMTTPVCAAIGTSVPLLAHSETPAGHVGNAGGGGFTHSLSEAVPRTVLPFPSLMKIAAADFGFGFGTAIGSELALDVSCIRHTRACALIFALTSTPGAPTFGSVSLRQN